VILGDNMGRPLFAQWQIMLNGASGLNDTSVAIAVNNSYSQSILIHWGKGVVDGEVIVECADSKDFSGKWAELTRLPFTDENQQDLYEHNGLCLFIRTRICKEVIGGTVTTKLQCLII
jgi:hypothetical protein